MSIRLATSALICLLLSCLGCQRKPNYDSFYYPENLPPGVQSINGVPTNCSLGQSTGLRTHPSGPTFLVPPIPVGSPVRNELQLFIVLPPERLPPQGDVRVRCGSASLNAREQRYPPRASDGSYYAKSCAADQQLPVISPLEGGRLLITFDAKEPLPDSFTLTLPEVQYPGTGLVMPAVDIPLRRMDLRQCTDSEVGGGWH